MSFSSHPVRPPDRPRSIQRARWGLLLVALAMGAALLASALLNWRDAGDTSRDLSLLSGMSLGRSVARDLVRSDDPPEQSLGWIVASLGEEGLRYAALVDRRGQVVAEGGRRSGPELEPPGPGHPAVLQPVAVPGGLVRLVLPPLRGGPPPHSRGGLREGLRRPIHERVWHRHFLVVEYEPLLADRSRRRALRTLLLSVGAALVLAVAGVVFWRLSVRAERTEAQLAGDRQLKTLGQMSAVLGHELRNPLASLKGNAQLLVESTDPGQPAHATARQIVEEAVRLERLTEQILDFARSGRLALAPADPSEAASAAAAQVETPRVRLLLEKAPERFVFDRQRMEQVLVNLLRNALQSSPPETEVELEVAGDPGELVFEVRDRGEGLAEEDLARIFEPFFTTRVRGTGLGLALARRIVEEHQGAIEAEARERGGTVFRVRLPGRGR